MRIVRATENLMRTATMMRMRFQWQPRGTARIVCCPQHSYGAKGVGEIGCVATAGAVASALHSYDGIRRYRPPTDDAPAAKPSIPKSRRTPT